jgi:tripartite-type tricarboxylate transporter receptor subunit TctC
MRRQINDLQETKVKLALALRTLALLATAAFGVSSAGAQTSDFPTRPIRLISGFAPGGATDLVARIVAQSAAEVLGQPVVVENKPGASGNIAAEMVTHSPADGYLLYLCNATIAMPAMFPHLPFNARKDFAPVTMVGYGPQVLAANPKFPVHSMSELLAYAKKNPGTVDFSSAGVGNITHIAMELLISMTGVKFNHIPYKGGAPATVAAISGEVPLVMTTINDIIPHAKQGTLVPLAISSKERSKVLPNVPTMAESGVPGYEASSWYGILAPAGTPKPVVEKLYKAIRTGMAKADRGDKLVASGMELAFMDPETFTQFLDKETSKWNEVITKAHITVE